MRILTFCYFIFVLTYFQDIKAQSQQSLISYNNYTLVDEKEKEMPIRFLHQTHLLSKYLNEGRITENQLQKEVLFEYFSTTNDIPIFGTPIYTSVEKQDTKEYIKISGESLVPDEISQKHVSIVLRFDIKTKPDSPKVVRLFVYAYSQDNTTTTDFKDLLNTPESLKHFEFHFLTRLEENYIKFLSKR